MNKPTLGLAIITNNYEDTIRLLDSYGQYFNKYFVTVADKDKKIYGRLKLLKDPKLVLSYFKWVDSFGKARLFNQKQIKTDYWFWCDSDDEIVNPDGLPALLAHAVEQDIDAMYLNYDYYQNEHGEQQANHWRERLIKTKSACEWADIPCHETVIVNGRAERSNIAGIKHHKSAKDMEVSMARNQVLLEKDWQTNKDPRTAFYLGMTYEYHKRYDEAVEMFLFLVKKGGWDEQKVISWNHIADCFFFQAKYDKGLEATDQAIHTDPAHPDAYYQKILIYCSANMLEKACEWVDVALSKKPNEETMQLVDPTRYTYKGLFLGAQANLFLGRVERAFELYQQVLQTAPHFLQQVNMETKTNWNQAFEEAYYDHKAVGYVKYLTHYLKDHQGNPKNLFASLPKKLYSDSRLNAERVIAIPPKQWPKKSIAIFCGAGLEDWGPENVKRGIGGSEEAIIYLSRELAKLGWNITVFCERPDDYQENPNGQNYVRYVPWTEFNPWDTFDVLWAWRQPTNIRGVKARRKIVDLHDTMPQELLESVVSECDMFMVKSPYHRSLYPKIPDNKITVVGNGIVR